MSDLLVKLSREQETWINKQAEKLAKVPVGLPSQQVLVFSKLFPTPINDIMNAYVTISHIDQEKGLISIFVGMVVDFRNGEFAVLGEEIIDNVPLIGAAKLTVSQYRWLEEQAVHIVNVPQNIGHQPVIFMLPNYSTVTDIINTTGSVAYVIGTRIISKQFGLIADFRNGEYKIIIS